MARKRKGPAQLTPDELEQLAKALTAEDAERAVDEGNGLIVARYLREKYGDDPVIRRLAHLFDPYSRIEDRKIEYRHRRKGKPSGDVRADVVGALRYLEVEAEGGRVKRAIDNVAKRSGRSFHTIEQSRKKTRRHVEKAPR